MSEPERKSSRKDIHVTMFSNTFGNRASDALDDFMWVAHTLGGHIAVAGEDYLAVAKDKFTPEEANAALHDWFNDCALEGPFEDEEWNYSILVYRVVEGTEKNAKETIVLDIADADLDFDSMDEVEAIQALKFGEDWKSEDGYLWVIRTAVWDDDERLKKAYGDRPAEP